MSSEEQAARPVDDPIEECAERARQKMYQRTYTEREFTEAGIRAGMRWAAERLRPMLAGHEDCPCQVCQFAAELRALAGPEEK